jgi:hypothetical protein
MAKYIDVTEEAGRAFFTSNTHGEVVMLNLLRYNKWADYSQDKSLEPENKITGRDAYRIYMKEVMLHLTAAESEVLFFGKCDSFLIGPQEEKWDEMILVKHKSKERFLEFASNEGYLKVKGHRTAALADSRLLPITEKQ